MKSVADAVDRTAEKIDRHFEEDDISRWLLEPDKPIQAATETQTLSMDDTNAVQAKLAEEAESKDAQHTLTPDLVDKPAPAEEKASKGKDKKKQPPGKLPPRATEPPTKDSRDAAAAALRNWNRRS